MQEDTKAYYVVNPGGTIHIVTRALAAWRLGQAGWRMAEAMEIKAYDDGIANSNYRNVAKEDADPKFKGKPFVQRTGQPLARPFVIDPDAAMAKAEKELRKVEAQFDAPEDGQDDAPPAHGTDYTETENIIENIQKGENLSKPE